MHLSSSHLPTLTRPPLSIVSFLDHTLFSIPGSALLAGYSFYKARGIPRDINFPQILQHLYQHRALAGLLGFVAVRGLSGALGRLVLNHGWRRDRPIWSFGKGEGDVVLVTGGATGIGKQVVELLAGKTDKIAVLDVASPVHAAGEYQKAGEAEGRARTNSSLAQRTSSTTNAT